MREAAPPERDTTDEPRPQFASAEEIALADRLRKQIEDRYLRQKTKTTATRDEPQPFLYGKAA
jgi:hypothetical protein